MLGQKTDFAGRDGFQWWIGEVESVKDPAMLGRVKVRVVGWYQKGMVGDDGAADYLDEMSSEDLPWATVLLPTDKPQIKNAGSMTELQVGAFVMGFFLDGDEAQLPVVLGAFRGFKKKEGAGGKKNSDDNDMSPTTIADDTETKEDAFQTDSPQRKGLTNQKVEGGHPFAKTQGQVPGTASGDEEQSRGAISRAEVETPFNVYTNPIGPPSTEGGIADGVAGPLNGSDSFSKDLKRMLTDLGVQIGSLGASSDGSLVSTITGHVQTGNNILKGITNISNYCINAVSGMIAPLKEILAQELQQKIQMIAAAVAKMVPLGVVTGIMALIKQIIEEIFCQTMPEWFNVVEGILSNLGGFVDQIFDFVMNAINQIIKKVMDQVTKALANIQKAICKVVNKIKNIFNVIMKGVNVIKKLSGMAQSLTNKLDKFLKLDFTQIGSFQNLLQIITLIVSLIAGFIDCGRKPRQPKSKGWMPLLGTTECSDSGIYGPGGNDGGDDCKAFSNEGSGGNFFDTFFQGINPYVMETKMFLNGARDIDDATPGKEKRIRSGPGGVTVFEEKKGNRHTNVPGNETAIYGRDLVQNVKNNLVHTIEGDYYLKVMGDFHIEVAGSINKHESNGPGSKADGKEGNSLGQDNNQWTKQATTAMDAAVTKLSEASKNVSFETGDKEAKSVDTTAGDHNIAYQGDIMIQGNQIKMNAHSAITFDAPDVHTSATAITNKASGEIVNEATWITSFLTGGRMDVIAIFNVMPSSFTGQYSLVNGSIVDMTMDGAAISPSPSMHVRLALGNVKPAGMADIVTGSQAGAHMTLVATPTGGIGEIVTGGSGAIVNQVTSGLLSHGCGTGLAAFGCALGPCQIYGLPVMLN